ncbi:MAG: carbohydrate ABC transporter permease [Anaerolineaceae bacterium]|nr:carbohydrate ABC transporter permease [Anaerolineaceae bacterium]MDE0328142.1 carbohydrate ABC transporter permease [Anaerolineaceae bacterium]MDE0608602.1 carbohydrate ABC transporter permease [Anaerolineaceae bacterium]
MTVINRLSTRRRGDEEVVERIPDWMPRNAADWLAMAFMVAIGMLTIMPIVWVMTTSLRTPAESFTVPPEWLPEDLYFGNYLQVFDEIPFVYQMGNSFFVTLSTVVGQLTTATLAGYTFARLYFPGRDALFWVVLATLMIPYQATLIPLFVIISKVFGLADTLWSLILPALPTAFGTFLLRQYFLQIPVEYEEAAMMDGANQFQIFRRVYLPMVAPGMAILAVLAFNGKWNDFLTPLIFMNTTSRFPITLGINDLQRYMMTGSISVVLAAIVMATLPVVIVYIFGQRYLIEGLMVGGLKG